MIIEDRSLNLKETDKNKYLRCGVLIDTNVLLVYFLHKFSSENSGKEHILKQCNITQSQIDCLNTIIQNLRIKKFVITPHILAEFCNRIKSDCKSDDKSIKKAILQELINIGEISIEKNSMLTNAGFIDFGNDISILLASEEQIKTNRYSTILSFDGRFINQFFGRMPNTWAFNMEVLSYQF